MKIIKEIQKARQGGGVRQKLENHITISELQGEVGIQDDSVNVLNLEKNPYLEETPNNLI